MHADRQTLRNIFQRDKEKKRKGFPNAETEFSPSRPPRASRQSGSSPMHSVHARAFVQGPSPGNPTPQKEPLKSCQKGTRAHDMVAASEIASRPSDSRKHTTNLAVNEMKGCSAVSRGPQLKKAFPINVRCPAEATPPRHEYNAFA
ncbi:hypothetical protein G6O67_000222 [Ophiocordyceps sinensis]|uniref:Uncharacterized protein n=1 Tax=Ophiocordyceps sinensis TaxID=72228 RepID=A0A8H4PYK3_9HYPO|nr:hypothetical protein G6O67_000222 [Ophiocordyceps sinensis]